MSEQEKLLTELGFKRYDPSGVWYLHKQGGDCIGRVSIINNEIRFNVPGWKAFSPEKLTKIVEILNQEE